MYVWSVHIVRTYCLYILSGYHFLRVGRTNVSLVRRLYIPHVHVYVRTIPTSQNLFTVSQVKLPSQSVMALFPHCMLGVNITSPWYVMHNLLILKTHIRNHSLPSPNAINTIYNETISILLEVERWCQRQIIGNDYGGFY